MNFRLARDQVVLLETQPAGLKLNVPFSFASGNIESLRETKLTVSLGASH